VRPNSISKQSGKEKCEKKTKKEIGDTTNSSGSHTRPSYSCDGWVCDLGVVGVPLIFGLARRGNAPQEVGYDESVSNLMFNEESGWMAARTLTHHGHLWLC
jgi:hypothetical protein